MIRVLFQTEESSREYEAAYAPQGGSFTGWLKDLTDSEFVRVKTLPGLNGYTYLRVEAITLIRVESVEVKGENNGR